MPLPSLQGQPQVSHLSAAMITYRMTISRANVTSASRLMREFSCNFTPCLRSGREALGHTGKDRRVGGRATAAGGACREVASVRQSRPVSLGGAGIALPMAGIPGLSPRPGYHRCAATGYGRAVPRAAVAATLQITRQDSEKAITPAPAHARNGRPVTIPAGTSRSVIGSRQPDAREAADTCGWRVKRMRISQRTELGDLWAFAASRAHYLNTVSAVDTCRRGGAPDE